MALFLSGEYDSNSTVYIAPLTNDKAELLSEDIVDTSGYFLFRRDKVDPRKIEILARAVSEDAAMNLARMLNLR